MKIKYVLFAFFIIIPSLYFYASPRRSIPLKNPLKLYWFIPDGLRAEPDLFTIYKWAEDGELPNIKKLMSQGSYGYSVPVFPNHTPVNFAALLTGTLPKTNGVSDGPMHTPGQPLSHVSIGGFTSGARRVPTIWTYLEDQGQKVGILSTPGSTPPEIDQGFVIRGRWGNWGLDTYSVIFQSEDSKNKKTLKTQSPQILSQLPQLTEYVEYTDLKWPIEKRSEFAPKYTHFKAWGKDFYACFFDNNFDSVNSYTHVSLSFDLKTEFVTLAQGDWSDWKPITLDFNEVKISSHVKFHPIKIEGESFFRLRLLFDSLNQTQTFPQTLASNLVDQLGPMVDFVDHYPPQLIEYREDKKTFIEEQNMSFDWHTQAISYMIKELKADVIIHNIYNPNQMLTSKWWLGKVDPESHHFKKTPENEKSDSWADIKKMYQQIDAMIGEIIDHSGPETTIVISSDHGVSAINSLVHLNNLFAQKGWLKVKENPDGIIAVDWEKTTVLFLKMDGIYINPEGLAGNWKQGHSPQYKKLRDEVIDELKKLKTSDNKYPLNKIAKWEDVENVFDLPQDRVGDLIVANTLGFGWTEEITKDRHLFSNPKVSGYKQALLPTTSNSTWTPFIISGPGIKKNYFIKTPFSQIDQMPTVMKTLGYPLKNKIDGKALEIFE